MSESKPRNEFSRYWPLVLISGLGVGIGVSSLPFYTQGVFINAWLDEFGWTRAEASYGILASTFALAAVSPFIGAAVDRFGLVKPIALSLIGLVISFILLGTFMNSLSAFIALSALMAILGGASSPLAYTRAINAVFEKHRGLALGLVLSGTGIAATFAPSIVSDIIEMHGWRMAYFALAGFVAVSGLAIVFVLVRVTKESTEISPHKVPSEPAPTVRINRTIFWRLLAAVFLLAIGVGGLIVHFVPILVEQGISSSAAAKTAGVIGVAVILGRLVVGALVDRVFAPIVAAIVIFLCIAGIFTLIFGGGNAAGIAAFAIGFAIGAEVDLIGYLVARYFGMTAYGRIYGQQYAAFLFGTGLSPVLIGRIADISDGYMTALYCSVGVLFVAAVMFLSLPKFGGPRDTLH